MLLPPDTTQDFNHFVGVGGLEPPKPKANDLQSFVIATTRYSQIRKGEDGCVDISFYDWHYFGVFLPTPMILTEIHSRVISTTIPQSTLHARQDSNLKLLVLETSTLPIELRTRFFKFFIFEFIPQHNRNNEGIKGIIYK